jgi:hypothetical protein
MRIRITDIHDRDDYSIDKEQLIGLEGEFSPDRSRGDNWYGGDFISDEGIELEHHRSNNKQLYFYAIRFDNIVEKEKVFAGPATKVLCINNNEVEGLLTTGRKYDVAMDGKSLYHLKCDRNYIFYFSKDKFKRIA